MGVNKKPGAKAKRTPKTVLDDVSAEADEASASTATASERRADPDAKPAAKRAARAPKEAPPGVDDPKRTTEATTKLFAAAGVAAAVVIAVVVSILSARHYKRWDLTRGGLFTLSPASVETLRSLPEEVKIILLMGDTDPMRAPVDETLVAYKSETDKLVVEYADPDKRPAEFIAVQQKYDLQPGREEDGRVVADAAMIVVHGDKHFFISQTDLVAFDEGNEMKASPRIEQALTGAIRSVFESNRVTACVTQGHGEPALDAAGDTGLAYLRDRLVKNNFDVEAVFGEDGATTEDHLHGCDFLVLAGPNQRIPPAQAKEIEAYLDAGGNALLVAGPIPYEPDNSYIDLGLDGVFAKAGVKLQNSFIFELDPASAKPGGFGDTFYPQIQNHTITSALLRERISIAANVSGSFADLKNDVTPLVLLKSSDRAIGLVDFFTWAKNPRVPKRGPNDLGGPLTLATASERPKKNPSDEHGPRIVAIASLGSLFGVNWREPEFRGMATFVENSISWASSHRAFLDIPSKPSMTMGLHLTEESLSSIRLYVFSLPAIAACVGVAIFFARRRKSDVEGQGEAAS